MSQFAANPRADIRRSSFKRDFGYKTAFNSGYLIPFFVDEVLPGDTFNLDLALFARLSTPIVPIMDNIYLETFFFFVPNRLVWDNFQKQMGERKKPGDSIDYLTPVIDFSTLPEGETLSQSTADYMGIPPVKNPGPVSALPFRAANLCFNEWFRDENLVDPVEVRTDDGPDPWYYRPDGSSESDPLVPMYPLLRRGKRKDYFTSSLPWPQKGPGVDIPLGASAPVIGNGIALGLTNGTNNGVIYNHTDADNARVIKAKTGAFGSEVGSSISGEYLGPNDTALGVTSDPEKSGLIADLSGSDPVTINQLRQAFMLQHLLETDSRGGTRYISLILSHFGVSAPDFRLQRPEYLGGSSGMINIHQVAQTSSTDTATPQGNLAGYGVYSDTHNGFIKSFVEHGHVIGFINVRCDLTYQQGLERFWSKRTRYDYYWPSLAHLGEQSVLNKEIYLQSEESDEAIEANNEVFGYQERYAEYRYKPSLVTGLLRTQANQSLDVWHLSQYFSNAPKLNSDFIQDDPPIARALAVQNEPQFILDAYFKYNCVRPMPVKGIPGLSSHF